MRGIDLTPRQKTCGFRPARGKQELHPKVHRMVRSSKRGKIPQEDWPLITKRYEAGETLAAIARTYDCSPPAISYILSRSRARDPSVDSVVQGANEPSQPRLMNTPMSETPLPAGQGDTGTGEAA